MGKAVKIVLVAFTVVLFTGCGLLDDPEVINDWSVKQDVLKLCHASSYSPNDVTVLNWSLDQNMLGDKYTGYIVTYEIGSGYYALASVVEFDETSKYEVRVVYHGKSLAKINDYIY